MKRPKKRRLYGLFKKEGRKWKREYDSLSLPLQDARRIFQNHLLTFAMGGPVEYRIRPLKR